MSPWMYFRDDFCARVTSFFVVFVSERKTSDQIGTENELQLFRVISGGHPGIHVKAMGKRHADRAN